MSWSLVSATANMNEIWNREVGCVSPRCNQYRAISLHLYVLHTTPASPDFQLFLTHNACLLLGDNKSSSPAAGVFSLFSQTSKTHLGQDTNIDSGNPIKWDRGVTLQCCSLLMMAYWTVQSLRTLAAKCPGWEFIHMDYEVLEGREIWNNRISSSIYLKK